MDSFTTMESDDAKADTGESNFESTFQSIEASADTMSSECSAEPMPQISYVPEEDITNPALLPPDHPLLQKFQEMLKECLLSAKNQLSEEVAELRRQLAVKEAIYAEDGIKLDNLTSHIARQNEQLEEKAKEAEEIRVKRMEMEKKAEELKKQHDSRLKENKIRKRLYEKSMAELENLNLLGGHIHNWADEVEDEVKNAQRTVHRDEQLQKEMSKEKKQADILFHNLDVEIRKLEKELKVLNIEVLDMREINKVLKDNIRDANTDLHVLESEHKRLMHAWNEVVVAIAHRDKILNQIQEQMNKEKETIKLNEGTIMAIKKQIVKETNINEKLETFKTRLLFDCGNLRNLCQIQSDNLQALHDKLEELPAWITQNEKDLTEATREGNVLKNEIHRLQWKIDRECSKKFHIEELILKAAEDQLVSDKASQYRRKLLQEARNTRRQMELNLALGKNQLAEALLDIERYKREILSRGTDNDELQIKLTSAEKRCDAVTAEITSMDTQIEIKLKKMEKIASRIDELNRSGIELGANTSLKKIRQIEKTLHAGEQQIREYQQFWLMLQNHYVNLSDKRNQQLNEIQITQKQLSIIKQKSLKIDFELETQEAFTRELERDIHSFESKCDILNAKMAKVLKKHNIEEKECELEHAALLNRLKGSEMEVLHIEEQINQIEVEIEEYKDQVLEKNREALSLEAKYKLIEETVSWRKEEQKRESETGLLKAEIHRLRLRHQQLLRVQQKIKLEFEHCVRHREHIYQKAFAKKAVEMKAAPRKSTMAAQPLDNVHRRLKKTLEEIKKKAEQVKRARKDFDRMKAESQRLESGIKKEQEKLAEMEQQFYKGSLKKLLNLERIVRKQNHGKSCRRMGNSTNVRRKTPRPKEILDELMQKEQKIKKDLNEVILTLSNEFPDLKKIFDKILCILQD